MIVTRRSAMTSAMSFAAVLALASRLPLSAARAEEPSRLGPPEPFEPALLRARAEALAKAPYVPVPETLPESLAGLDYDQYRHIRFRPEAALLADGESPFTLQLFHLGFGYRMPVAIALVSGGEARPVLFDQALFSYGPLVPEPPGAGADLGFSGFRIHGPINSPDRHDEFTVFQGASYFRGVAEGQVYGISARGLAVATADPSGEEFPAFRAFWIEEPAAGDAHVVVHALLDSPSTTGAYRFVVRPGAATVMDVEATLFPRTEIATIGIAPLTSMFYFARHDRRGIDDFRGAVHDSEGLAIWNGAGERLWRPLLNPATLQVSMFLDDGPRGFGLMQRNRDFGIYQDLEAAYHRRPCLWVEPLGDWGAGAVTLVEIPTPSEVHDNIVAFWRPREPVPAGAPLDLAYRLHWRDGVPGADDVASVARTLVGLAEVARPQHARDKRIFIVEFEGQELEGQELEGQRLEGEGLDSLGEPIRAQASASAGHLARPVVMRDDAIAGVRVALELDPQGARLAELRCALYRGDTRISEAWIYRWLA